MRFSLAGLLGLVLLCAVAVASLRFANEWLASAVFTATLAILSLGFLGALFRSGDSRAFWSGFVLFGWGYLALALGPWFSQHVGMHLLTTRMLYYLHSALQTEVSVGSGGGPAMGGGLMPAGGMTGTFAVVGPAIEFVQQIGHSWFALLGATVGALLVKSVRRRGLRDK